jgi:uncharacterized membrane protein
MRVALFLHLVAVVVWVGGMFFAHVALRPAVAALEPPQRLTLMAAALGRFLCWVAGAVVVILATGFGMLAATPAGAGVGTGVATMAVVGVAMVAIYVDLVLQPYRRLAAAVAAKAWPDAAAALAGVRRRVEINLGLGLVTIAAAVLGRGGA